MAGLSDMMNRLQYKSRIDSVTKTAVDDFRSQGVVPMLIGLGTRFGRNNRALIGR
ncbi:MAG: hypothetical protein ACREDE_09100 [Thermoplasmata archaeon]